MAGVAHEVKNPLNAMTIHLELLKQKLAQHAAVGVPAGASPRGLDEGRGEGGPADPSKHVNVIADEIRRLDQVVAGFLKFARPDELKLQPVKMDTLVSDVVTTATPEAERHGVTIKVDCPPELPPIHADPGMLRQALLNLALNACQAMPGGGTLKIAARPASRRRVEIDVDRAGTPQPYFRSVFHDEREGLGHRAVDGLPHRPAPRRRSRGAIDAGDGNAVSDHVGAGLGVESDREAAERSEAARPRAARERNRA
jgi:light-regulated signal transduction histidine kinase (bacteriophytochrome)